MGGPPAGLLVAAALRCYPDRWRRRHGEEAAELAALLIVDGKPAASVALSYLAGAARAWLTPRPGRPLSTAACALLVAAGAVGLSAGLLASAGPARAASAGQARRPAHCQVLPAVPLRSAVPAAGWPPVIFREAGHGRPC